MTEVSLLLSGTQTLALFSLGLLLVAGFVGLSQAAGSLGLALGDALGFGLLVGSGLGLGLGLQLGGLLRLFALYFRVFGGIP